ncbi:deoxynucleotidyltransferase terminal-interacting protein 2 [Stomoxys calcitrans]|uniref:deoxynucleotidyltransferase terminal-interacting protein 2 n=1 Tax=Stomoxys calcitrans TaxID=35570 RepID=UPI0027E2AADD|nr:deoxynucleotidyltransferase terminal-interacting protein 2 [Stomoxys calcitrans]
MSLFVLDTLGNQDLLKTEAFTAPKFNIKQHKVIDESTKKSNLSKFTDELKTEDDKVQDDQQEYDFFGLPPPSVDISDIIANTLSASRRKESKVEQEMDQVILKSDEASRNKSEKKPKLKRMIDLDHSDFNEFTGKRDESQIFKTDIQKELVKTEMVPNLEQLKELPSVTQKRQRVLNRIERSKTKGKKWFNMPATELTEEAENDLKILQMRSVLDPKHFYKKNDLKVLPKYFQIGTVQHSALDFYSERHERKNKKHTLVDELLADTEAQKYIKRKNKEIVMMKQKYAQRKAMKKMKKLKKNK